MARIDCKEELVKRCDDFQAETGRDVAWLAEREVRSTKLYVVASCSSGVPTPIPFSEWEIKGTKKLKEDFSQKRGLLHLGQPESFLTVVSRGGEHGQRQRW